MNSKNSVKKISVIGMLCAVAYLCMFLLKIKIGFLTFDLKDAFLAIISFLYGPLYAVFSAILVAVLEFLSVSDTGVYGLIMNAISSAVFAGTCGAFYKYRRTFYGAVFGAVAAVFIMTIIMLFANWLITPHYMGVARSDVAAMIPTLLLPFNLIKGIVNMGLTLIIYKPVTAALKRTGLIVTTNTTNKMKFATLSAISATLIAACVLIIFLIFDGKFEIFL